MTWRDTHTRANVIPAPNEQGEMFAKEKAKACTEPDARARFVLELMVRGAWWPAITELALADLWTLEGVEGARVAAQAKIEALGGLAAVRQELIFAEAMRTYHDCDARGRSKDAINALRVAHGATTKGAGEAEGELVFRVEMVKPEKPERPKVET